VYQFREVYLADWIRIHGVSRGFVQLITNTYNDAIKLDKKCRFSYQENRKNVIRYLAKCIKSIDIKYSDVQKGWTIPLTKVIILDRFIEEYYKNIDQWMKLYLLTEGNNILSNEND
jgi:hypothetical protein